MLFITSIPHYLGSYLGQKSYSLRSFFALWFGKTQTSFLWPSFNTFTDFFSSKKKKWSSVFHLELRNFLVPLKSFFELWCWRRLLRIPWTVRRSIESILKEISPGCSLEGLMLKLKLQYFGHLMWRTDTLEKTLMLGKSEGGRRREWQRMRWLIGIT